VGAPPPGLVQADPSLESDAGDLGRTPLLSNTIFWGREGRERERGERG
jgi:hypothetical protein